MSISTMFRTFSFLLFLSNFTQVFGLKIAEQDKCLMIHNRWIKESFVLTKNTVGFSAPVSARAYAYFTIGIFESTVELYTEQQSLSGQLDGYQRNKWSSDPALIDWCLVANTVDKRILEYLYRNMPPSNALRVAALSDSIERSYSRNISREKRRLSLEYGNDIAQMIIDWSKNDGSDEGFNKNYPEDYKPPVCYSCWTKTTPGYFSAVQPFWGLNKHLIFGGDSLLIGCKPMPFSKEENSPMFKDALLLYKTAKEPNPAHELIAEYWDDSPGYSGTPTGHLMQLALQLVEQRKLAPAKAMELYVKMGVAINEAFIHCWKLKYTFNLLRPISYIQRFIDPQFNTFIATPSFPEFPSGHSFQSGAGTQVLKEYFSDTLEFSDNTNIWRSDIDGTARTYASFTQLSEEISMSRFYGGIHFKTTLDTSLYFGRIIGSYVLKSINCTKQ